MLDGARASEKRIVMRATSKYKIVTEIEKTFGAGGGGGGVAVGVAVVRNENIYARLAKRNAVGRQHRVVSMHQLTTCTKTHALF